jgi:hypothetical protein
MKAEIGTIENFRFIMTPQMPGRTRKRRRLTEFNPSVDGCYWHSLYKDVPANKPRTVSSRTASARKRKHLLNGISRRVPNGFVMFL